jgi:hypothetical protein
MAAQNLTTAALVAVQRLLSEFIPGQNPTQYGRLEPSNVLNALGQKGYANYNMIRDEAGRCRTLEVNWIRDSANASSVATSMPAIACDIAATDGLVAAKKSYTPNLFVSNSILVDDDTCGTLFDTPNMGLPESQRGAILVAEALMQLMQKNRRAIETELITRLNTNRQTANYDASLPPWLTFDGTNDKFDIQAQSYFNEPDYLTDFDAVMQNNDITDYFFLGGRHAFYNSTVNALYRQENDNQRYFRRFGLVDIANDIRQMDSRLNTIDGTSGNTYMFGIGAGSYVLGNFSYFGDVPVQLKNQSEPTFVFRAPDPVVTLNQGGQTVRLYHDVVHKTGCGGVDGRGIPTGLHEFAMTTKMVWDVAPTDIVGRTGLLKFVAPVGL